MPPETAPATVPPKVHLLSEIARADRVEVFEVGRRPDDAVRVLAVFPTSAEPAAPLLALLAGMERPHAASSPGPEDRDPLAMIRQTASFWGVEIPEPVLRELGSRRFGAGGYMRVNVYAWDRLSRALGADWWWVLSWVDAGYPEPPVWMLLMVVDRFGALREAMPGRVLDDLAATYCLDEDEAAERVRAMVEVAREQLKKLPGVLRDDPEAVADRLMVGAGT